MSTGTWKVRKTLKNEEYSVEFQSYFRDIKGGTSQERVSDRNRIVATKVGDTRPCLEVFVHNAFGNYYYDLLKTSAGSWEHILDTLYLDLCAFHDDYDAYSDVFKDIYNVRPHYTPNQWDDLVRAARNRGY